MVMKKEIKLRADHNTCPICGEHINVSVQVCPKCYGVIYKKVPHGYVRNIKKRSKDRA